MRNRRRAMIPPSPVMDRRHNINFERPDFEIMLQKSGTVSSRSAFTTCEALGEGVLISKEFMSVLGTSRSRTCERVSDEGFERKVVSISSSVDGETGERTVVNCGGAL